MLALNWHRALPTSTPSTYCQQRPRSALHESIQKHYLSMQKCFSSSSDIFHGISLNDKIKEDGVRVNSTTIREAEVVQSEEDKRRTRHLIKEVTRATMTAHYSDVSNENSDDTSNSKGDVSERKTSKLDSYERRLSKLNHAQRLHNDIDQNQQIEAYTHSCMVVGELQYELGYLDDAQDMYMAALKTTMNSGSSSSDVGDDDHGRSVGEQLIIAQCMHSLGAIHARCGEYDEALQCYDESLKRKQQLLLDVTDKIIDGDNATGSLCLRYELAKTYNGLATLEVMKGGEVQWEKALSLLQEAERNYLHGYDIDMVLTKATIEQMTPRHVEALINVRSNIGELLRQRGKNEDAVNALRLALDTAKIALETAIEREATIEQTHNSFSSLIDGPSLDEQRNAVVDLLLQLAGVLMSANNFDEAAATYEQALSAHMSFRKNDNAPTDHKPLSLTTPTNPKVGTIDLSAATRVEATIRTNLAHALAQIGQERLSLEQYQAALSIKRLIGGDSHLEVAHTLMNMGALLGGPLRDFTKALICFKEALYIFRTNLEESSRANNEPEKSIMPLPFDDDDSTEIERHAENALKNISLIEAALLKDRDGKSRVRRK